MPLSKSSHAKLRAEINSSRGVYSVIYGISFLTHTRFDHAVVPWLWLMHVGLFTTRGVQIRTTCTTRLVTFTPRQEIANEYGSDLHTSMPRGPSCLYSSHLSIHLLQVVHVSRCQSSNHRPPPRCIPICTHVYQRRSLLLYMYVTWPTYAI